MTTAKELLADPLFAVPVHGDDVLQKDISLSRWTLNEKKLSADITKACNEADLELTIKGASTLTMSIDDQHLKLLNSGMFHEQTVARYEGLAFRLVKIGFSGSQIDLEFEDDEVFKMRKFKKPRKAVRGKVTRAQFARTIFMETKAGKFICPELNEKQPIKGAPTKPGKSKTTEVKKSVAKTSERKKQETKAPGFAPSEKFTIKGVQADKDQRKIAETILDVAYKMDVPYKIMLAEVIAAIQESVMRNLAGGDGTSSGVFQQTEGNGWGTAADRRNPAKAARMFLDAAVKYVKSHPSASAPAIAQGVQKSAYPSAYSQWVKEGKKIVKLYLNGAGKSDSGSGGGKGDGTQNVKKVKIKPYLYTRGAPGGPVGEDTWACLQRLSSEVNWRCFVYRGDCNFVSDQRLMQAKPLATWGPYSPGVLEIPSFDIDVGKKVSELDMVVLATKWQVPPGSVVNITGLGPANGRWLVESVKRSLFGQEAEIHLIQPLPKLPEPPNEVVVITQAKKPAKGDGGGDNSKDDDEFSGVPDFIKKMYKKAWEIDAKNYDYVGGGGHNSFAGPYDCSGFASAVFHAGGKLSSPKTTYGLDDIGQTGKGKYLTWYVHNVSDAMSSHVYLVFNMPGKGKELFEAGGSGGKTGKHPMRPPKSGYYPHHFPNS